jgi:hypothetical protein
MRRDDDATELRSDILRKNALIADLTAMKKRNKLNGTDDEEEEQYNHIPTDGAVELELAQTKVKLILCKCIHSCTYSF